MGEEDLLNLFDKFFKQDYGKSLVIKGKPGAGKTTFALEFIDIVRKDKPVYYLSARFSDDPLKDIFPWLSEISDRDDLNGHIIENVHSESLRKLERMIEEGKLNTGINDIDEGLVLNIQDLIPEINALYSFVDKNINDSPIVVIDSIDALSEKYGIDQTILFSMLHNDLVEKSGANVIAILEAAENTKLEYFSDGVVSMDYFIKSDFLVRSITIEKLRGISVGSSPIFLYSLKNGRFHPFSRRLVKYPEKKIKINGEPDIKPFEVSLGNPEFSKLLENGSDTVPLGSVIIFHRENNSTSLDNIVNLAKNNLIKTTIMEKRGVIDVTSSSYETSRVLISSIDQDSLKHYITAEKSKRSNSYVINLEGKNLVEDFPHEVIDFFMSSSSRPDIYIFSTDFLLFTYGDQFFGDLVNLINGIRTTGIVVIIADDEYYRKISHYATNTVHFKDINGYVLVNSNHNSVFVASPEYTGEEWPELELFEIV